MQTYFDYQVVMGGVDGLMTSIRQCIPVVCCSANDTELHMFSEVSLFALYTAVSKLLGDACPLPRNVR